MITSRHNQKLKDLRRLRRSKGDHALLEGPDLVGEAIASGLEPETVLATPAWLKTPEGQALRSRLTAPPLEVEPAILDGLTDADSPRGVLALVHLPRSGAAALPIRADGVYLYLDGLQDPGNLGALARVAEAAGAAGLALAPGTVHPNHPRALRASAGSLLRLPVAVAAEPGDVDSRLASVRPRWMAMVPRGGATLWEADLGGTLVLAVGAEGPGLSAALEARAELRVTIQIETPVESLNVTVAAALALFEVRRRRSSMI